MTSILNKDENYLEIEFNKSKNINEKHLNTIRRCIYQIELFAFDTEHISISVNTSILHNDMIKSRISLLPILSIIEKNKSNVIINI